MHRSREAGRNRMENHLSRPGDCGRYAAIQWDTLQSRSTHQSYRILMWVSSTGFKNPRQNRAATDTIGQEFG